MHNNRTCSVERRHFLKLGSASLLAMAAKPLISAPASLKPMTNVPDAFPVWVRPFSDSFSPKITILGIGGLGSDAVNSVNGYFKKITSPHSFLDGKAGRTEEKSPINNWLNLIAVDSDADALAKSQAGKQFLLETDFGYASIERSLDAIKATLHNTDMLLIGAGMGGRTGTYVAPLIARAARDMGILTIGLVTTPKVYDDAHHAQMSAAGYEELSRVIGTFVIPNWDYESLRAGKVSLRDMPYRLDSWLIDLAQKMGGKYPFLDVDGVRSVMSEKGTVLFGSGFAEGRHDRHIRAVDAAINNPRSGDNSIRGAKGAIVHISGSQDMTLYEALSVKYYIQDMISKDGYIVFTEEWNDYSDSYMAVSLIATGIPS